MNPPLIKKEILKNNINGEAFNSNTFMRTDDKMTDPANLSNTAYSEADLTYSFKVKNKEKITVANHQKLKLDSPNKTETVLHRRLNPPIDVGTFNLFTKFIIMYPKL